MDNHPLNRRHNIDTAMSSIWETYKKMFLPLFSISFISALLVSYLSSGIDIAGIQSMTDPAQIMEAFKPLMGKYLLISLIGITFSSFMQYYIIHKPGDDSTGMMEMLIKFAGRFLLPLLAVYIILGVISVLAISLGLLALIIGALFVFFYVAIFFTLSAPVMMIENRSVGETISRVFSLGHKKFWLNLGWVTLFMMLLIIISMILSSIILVPFAGGFLKSIFNQDAAVNMLEFSRKPSFLILSSVASALTAPIYPIFSVVLYFNAASYENEVIINTEYAPEGEKRVTVEDLYSTNNREKEEENDGEKE